MALKIVLGHGCRMRNGNTFGAHKNYLYAAHKRHRLTNMPVVVQRRQAGRRAHAHAREISTQDQRQQATGRQAKGAGQDNATATRTVQSSLSLSPGPHKYRHAFADRIKIVALVFNARTRRYRSSHSSRRSSSSSHSTLFRNWLPGLLDSRRRWARGLRLKWQPGTVVS